ncbi:hypothetical protein [Mycobacteroides abscessus]|uniref:hypothetical protein n=1 Tax=Mycobacteroides abscessus TaxID=36809 RepID=UPI00177FDECC|nr:hypothetical protein [Mycobacteroides abscessus]
MKARKAHIPAVLRRSLAVVAIGALLVGGIKISAEPDASLGTFGLPGATADPTGPMPTGGGMGPGGMNGGQFVPPNQPPSMPDYQGGINQPPLNQDSGVSIYNTGSPGAQQNSPQQGGQQAPAQNQQPAHGTQPPDYETATPFTQGPGKPNPDYQAPQQNTPQQPQQGSQQQPQQQPQNQQDQSTQQLDQKQQKCQAAMLQMGNTAAAALVSVGGTVVGGAGRSPIWFDPWLDPTPTPSPCNGACPPDSVQKPPGEDAPKKDYVSREEAEQIAKDAAKKAVEDSKNEPKQCNRGEFVWGLVKTVGGMIGTVGSVATMLGTGGAASVLAVGGIMTGVASFNSGIDSMKSSGC